MPDLVPPPAVDRSGVAPEPSFERFTQAVKACRDILVDDVDRYLGVPIIGDPAPLTSIGPGAVQSAQRCLAAAIAALERDPVPSGPHVRACREHLAGAARLLGAPAGTVVTTTATPRQLRLARRRVAAAIDHLTIVLFSEDSWRGHSPDTDSEAT